MTTSSNPDHVARIPQDLIFIIPKGAPLPRELEDLPLATGSLYQRLAPLAEASLGWHLVPMDTMEINDLANSWERLVEARAVGYLTGLPGTVSDPLMEHVSVTLAIKLYRWDDLAVEMAEKIKAEQRSTAKPPELDTTQPAAPVEPTPARRDIKDRIRASQVPAAPADEGNDDGS